MLSPVRDGHGHVPPFRVVPRLETTTSPLTPLGRYGLCRCLSRDLVPGSPCGMPFLMFLFGLLLCFFFCWVFYGFLIMLFCSCWVVCYLMPWRMPWIISVNVLMAEFLNSDGHKFGLGNLDLQVHLISWGSKHCWYQRARNSSLQGCEHWQLAFVSFGFQCFCWTLGI